MSWRRLQRECWSASCPTEGVVGRGEGFCARPRSKVKEFTNEAMMSWTDERVEQLRQQWLEGKSASQIATLLGHGLTRNAVIGKVHRLGLAGRAKSPTSTAPRPRVPSSQPAVHRAAPARATMVAPRVVRGATALAIAPQ